MDSMQGKRLVIFGAGYTGGALARQAIRRGLRVTALTRNATTGACLRADGADVVIADLANPEWHSRIAASPEFVLNAVSAGSAGLEGYQRSYIEGMRSLLEWARIRGTIGTIVYTSSTSVYPQGEGATVDETATHQGVSERGELLLEAERVLREAASARTGRSLSGEEGRPNRETWAPYNRYFVLRLAGIYGPDRHRLLDQVRGGAVAGRGDYRLNLIHREDVCAAIWKAFEAPAEVGSDVFNVADDAPASKAEIAAWLATRLRLPLPGFTGQPAGTRRAVTPDRLIANGKIKGALHWQPQFPDYRAGYENILSHRGE